MTAGEKTEHHAAAQVYIHLALVVEVHRTQSEEEPRALRRCELLQKRKDCSCCSSSKRQVTLEGTKKACVSCWMLLQQQQGDQRKHLRATAAAQFKRRKQKWKNRRKELEGMTSDLWTDAAVQRNAGRRKTKRSQRLCDRKEEAATNDAPEMQLQVAWRATSLQKNCCLPR